MAERKKHGPYKGSKQNDGRPIYVYKEKKNGKWTTTSTNKARADYQEKTGKKLSKKVDVDHKDNNKKNDSKSNLRAMPKSKNVGKENKRRAKK